MTQLATLIDGELLDLQFQHLGEDEPVFCLFAPAPWSPRLKNFDLGINCPGLYPLNSGVNGLDMSEVQMLTT